MSSAPLSAKAKKKNPKKEIKPLDDYVREYVLAVFEQCDFNKAKTARMLGLSLSTLQRKLRRWGVTVTKNLT